MTQTATKTQKQIKPVHICGRCQFKANGVVLYRVRSSNGVDFYDVTIINGKATGCQCPSTAGHCYHRDGCEHAEAIRSLCSMAQAIAQAVEIARARTFLNLQALFDVRFQVAAQPAATTLVTIPVAQVIAEAEATLAQATAESLDAAYAIRGAEMAECLATMREAVDSVPCLLVAQQTAIVEPETSEEVIEEAEVEAEHDAWYESQAEKEEEAREQAAEERMALEAECLRRMTPAQRRNWYTMVNGIYSE